MNLLSNIFREKRMERQILWLIKHLAIMLRKNISIFASRCKRKPSVVLDVPVRPVSETGPGTDLTGNAVVGSNSAKKDDSIVSAEAQDWRVSFISY